MYTMYILQNIHIIFILYVKCKKVLEKPYSRLHRPLLRLVLLIYVSGLLFLHVARTGFLTFTLSLSADKGTILL